MEPRLPLDPERATAFAKFYTALTEALMREGVPEELARYEARCTAAMVLLFEPESMPEPWELPDAE